MFNINSFEIKGIFKQIRFNYLTIDDFHLLKSFEKDYKNNYLINRNWRLYSRDDKISSIFAEIE